MVKSICMTHQCRYDWLSSYGTTEKIEVDPISMDEWKWQIFAVYGSNGTEFSYGFF